MSLTKLFNFNYLKENMKKSRGFIALLLIVVPIFTLLLAVLNFSEPSTVNVLQDYYIVIINYIGMYVIPVLISFILFGYVYSKRSVDFIGSQPINRKTIFITNTVGGIILLTAIQIVTAIILFICSLVLPITVIFPQMIFEMFILMWVSYIFVFLATNVAMSMSGTFTTQIALTMLILFLIPFSIDNYKGFFKYQQYVVEDGQGVLRGYAYDYKDTHYTMPYEPFHLIVNSESADYTLFSSEAIIKMLGLSIVYYFVGLHLFQNRKMENNEESFFDQRIHELVKALTMFPMMALLNLADEINAFVIIALALIITYYFVYDFIVKRKIKFKTSIIYLVIILAVLQGICSANNAITDKKPEKKIRVDEIIAVRLDRIQGRYFYSDVYNKASRKNVYIENDEIIKMIFDSFRDVQDSKYDDYTYMQDGYMPIYEEEVYVAISLKTKDNKYLEYNLEISESVLKEMLEKMEQDTNYMNSIKEQFMCDGELLLSNRKIFSKEEKQIILEEIRKETDNMKLEELYKLGYGNGFIIEKYYYKDHTINRIAIKPEISNKVLEIVAKFANDDIANMEKNDEFNDNIGIIRGEEKIYFNYLQPRPDLYKFMEENKNETFDASKPYIIFCVYNRLERYFYTNNIEELNNYIENEKELERKYETNYYGK